jgi:hypothetical protein
MQHRLGLIARPSGLENGRSAAHIRNMGAGWKFLGEFKRGRKASLLLECIVELRNRKEAETIAHKKLVDRI